MKFRFVDVIKVWLRSTSFKKKIALAVGLFFLISIFFVVLLLPDVFQLAGQPSLHLTRWDRSRGEIRVAVGPNEKSWISLENTSMHIIHAIIVSEDSRFYSHIGIDPIEIWRSMIANFEEGRIVRGASTITQQVVKLLFLSNEKTIVRKIREILGAVALEFILSKDEILAWYINIIDFGNGVYGINDSSHYYFETPPEVLTISQAIQLAMVLPGPNKRSRAFAVQSFDELSQKRFRLIAKRMHLSRYITKTQLDSVLATGNFGNPIKINE